MKKKLLALLLVLILVVSVTVISATAEESTEVPETPATQEYKYCKCGGYLDPDVATAIGHKCNAETWTPLTQEMVDALSITTGDALAKTDAYTLTHGNYVLTEDITLDKSLLIPQKQVSTDTSTTTTVKLDLNGHTLSGAETLKYAVVARGNFQISDCAYDPADSNAVWGKIVGASNPSAGGSAVYVCSSSTTFLYGGELKSGATQGTVGGPLAVSGKLHICNGQVVGYNTTANGGAINVNDSGNLTVWDGKVIGSNAKNGGAIYTAYRENYNPKITIRNKAIVTAGTATGKGDCIYAIAPITVRDGAQVDGVYLHGTAAITITNLTGKVGLEVAAGDFRVVGTATTEEDFAHVVSLMPAKHYMIYNEGNIEFVDHLNHCVCGGTLSGVAAENHTCSETAPQWTALTTENIARDAGITVASDRETDSKYNMFAQSGCYYLSENIKLEKNFEIRPGQEITICLNGYTLSTGHAQTIFRITGGKLNICDCTGEGSVKATWTGAAPLVFLLNGYADATEGVTFNLYGGNLTSTGKSTTNGAGVAQISNNNTATPAIMNVYGGTITGCSRKSGGAINMVNSSAATLNIYGGTITGGKSDNYGGNISCTSGTVNLYGGTVSGGTAATQGGNIYINNVAADRLGALYIHNAKVIDGTAATRGGNIYINKGTFAMYGGTVTGGTLTAAECGADIGISATTPISATLDGKVTIGEIGAFGNSADSFAWAIGENFSTDKPIKVSAKNLDKVIKNVTPDLLASFEAASETAQLTLESGDIYLRSADVHYACYCGGTYAEGGSVIKHTCSMTNKWVAVNSEFLTSSNTTTETVNGTDAEGNPTTEEVTTVTGFGTPVEDTSEALGGTYYHVPSGYYYLAEDITLEHGLRIAKDATVYIDLNGHTITGSATNARPLFIQGNLRICDSSYDATKTEKAEQFQGGIISTRPTSYNLCYVSGEGALRIFGGKYSTTAESVERGIFGATGAIYIFDGYIKGANSVSGASVFELHEGTKNDGLVSIYRATIEAGTAKNGGIVNMGGAEEAFNVYSGNLIGAAVAGDGGVIYANKGVVVIAGGTISGGSAIRGGNIFVGADARLTVKGGEIIGGSAIGAASGTNGGGGNIYAAGDVTITGGTISGGIASRTQPNTNAYGGNIYMNSSSKTLTISNGTISGGEAVTGGNIFARGTFNLSGGTIDGGFATSAIAGNIRVEGEKSICNITGGTISNGVAFQQGGNIVVRNSGNEVIITGATISGGISQTSHGGSVYIVGITENVTMENTTITGGTAANRAGNLYIMAAQGAEDVVATLTNCTITGGTTGDRGGNIYFADVACTMNNCTVTGGSVVGTETNMIGADLYGANIATNTGNHATALTINGGTYGGFGENNLALTSVHVLSSDDPYTLTVTGAPVIDDLRLGTDRMLIVDQLTEGANIGISRFEISGLVSEGAAQYAQYFHATVEGVRVDTDGANLILVSDIPYWAFDANGNIIAPANTIADALDMENVSFIRLVADVVSDETINGDVYVDLYGHDLSGLTVNGNLYVVDMASNDYEENVVGSLSCTVNGSINGDKTVYAASEEGNFNVNAYYVMLPNADGSYSFHRANVEITHISLDAGKDALGFKATISGDSAVKAAVTGFGFNMGVKDGKLFAYSKTGNPTDGVFTMRVKNIMKNNGGLTTIVGQPVLYFGEELVEGSTYGGTTMKQTIESVEAAVAADANAYTQAQIASVQALIAQFESKMEGWDIDSIKAWTAPTPAE